MESPTAAHSFPFTPSHWPIQSFLTNPRKRLWRKNRPPHNNCVSYGIPLSLYEKKPTLLRIVSEIIGFLLISFWTSTESNAQGIGINNQGMSPYPGAILDVMSSDKGVLLPRTDTAGIVNPTAGMIIYDTLDNVFRYYSGQRWLAMLQEGYYQFWWADMDGDGYGYPFNVIYSPGPPEYYVGNNEDCDDQDPDKHPGLVEICDGLDNDCNGLTDDGLIPPDCMVCMGANGWVLSPDHCLIDEVCYEAGSLSPLSPCLVCDPAENPTEWSNNCSATQECCENECIDISSDMNNCGGCNLICDDGNPCTIDFCVNGVCISQFAPAGTPCPDGECDGAGNCEPICPNGCDDGNPCTIDYCVNGVCISEFAPAGTTCPDGECDGAGNCEPICPNGCDDGNPCTIDLCINGVCVNEFAPAGTACPNGQCDGNGNCIED